MLSLPGIRPRSELDGLKTLVVGAGEAGRTLARALRRSPNYGLSPDRLPRRCPRPDPGRRAARVPARSRRSPRSRGRTGRTRASSRSRHCPPRRLAEIVDTARTSGLHVRYLPSFLAAVERDARLSDLRQLRVENLLGRRELHVVSEKAAALISGRRVLVTGAGGSIGSELCRQIQRLRAAVAATCWTTTSPTCTGCSSRSPETACSTPTRSSSPTSATSAGSTRSSRPSGPSWSSMRRPTSTCRCWNVIRARP